MSLKMGQLAHKFLKFLYYQKSASPCTLAAYNRDLSQFLYRKNTGIVKIASKTKEFTGVSLEKYVDYDPYYALAWNSLTGLKTWLFESPKQWSELSAATRQRKVACIKSFLVWAFTYDHVVEDLSVFLGAPKVPQRVPNFISVDEVVHLIKFIKYQIETVASVPESTQMLRGHQRDLALILLLYGGGLRINEACQLEWRNVEFSRRRIKVLGKGNKERWVPLPLLVMQILTRLKEASPISTMVFDNPPLSSGMAYHRVRNWGARCGISQRLHPHALRHSYATHLLASGGHLRTLQELLGHATLLSTQKYLHLDIQSLARTMQNHHPLGKLKAKA